MRREVAENGTNPLYWGSAFLFDLTMRAPVTREKRHFDILLVIPLEEELLEVQKAFAALENLSNDTYFRFSFDTGDQEMSMLVVQQAGMGKTFAHSAVADAFVEFDFSVVVCLGITGSLTGDLNLCDVCYSECVIDILDNSKVSDTKNGDLDLSFSTNYLTACQPLVVALNFTRTWPELQVHYEKWRDDRRLVAEGLLAAEVPGRDGTAQRVGAPKTKNGKIVCGGVSNSDRYTNKIKEIDRKVLAIETESGGIFEAASKFSRPALSIRGISDHADRSKNKLEDVTGGVIRAIAAGNAATFFRLQFSNPRFKSVVKSLWREHQRDQPAASSISEIKPRDITDFVSECAASIDSRLRDLSPEYKLLDKGYRLPVPRMRNVQYISGLGTKFSSDPEEVREAIERHNTILLGLSKNYPDHSLAWIIANDLLTAVVGGRQLIPVVVDGDAVRPPRIGLSAAAHWKYDEVTPLTGAQLVFIVDGAPLSSKTRSEYLIKEMREHTDAKFIIISRDETQIITESAIVAATSAELYQLTSISFLEIAHFVEKNFGMTAPEAELIALRLNETFRSFDLSAHPTYFTGITRELLSTLLQANRRAELIQLAVDGFLTLVVAGDTANITLSRTTRARFLRMLIKAIKVERTTLTYDAVLSLSSDFAKEYGFDIDPAAFIVSFIDCGILHLSSGKIVFSLPFIESYLLAVELAENPTEAVKYFDFSSDSFDITTFDLYCEIKPASSIIETLLDLLQEGREEIALRGTQKHILLTDAARPAMITKTERLRAIEERFNRLSEDVRAGKGDVRRKQKMLDIAERVREAASEQSGLREDETAEDQSEEAVLFQSCIRYWAIGATMLGAAAEHLRAEDKERLTSTLVDLVSFLSHTWTDAYARVDFSSLRETFAADDMVKSINGGSIDSVEMAETRRQIENMVDLLEFSLLASPLRRLLDFLCERARLKVLFSSIERAGVSGDIQSLVHAAWLADIDGKKGHDALIKAVKSLPASPFLRIVVATHLMSRVYWNQSDQADRKRFLDAAEIALRPIVTIKKGEIMRYIDSHSSNNAPPVL
jgi:nucleoside phosphorylase/acyl carrier protein